MRYKSTTFSHANKKKVNFSQKLMDGWENKSFKTLYHFTLMSNPDQSLFSVSRS